MFILRGFQHQEPPEESFCFNKQYSEEMDNFHTEKESKPLTTWQLLRSRKNLAKLILARFISMLGDYIHTVTAVWIVKDMSGSASAMALVFSANTIPRIIFNLFGGVFVDQYDRKTILVLSDVLQAAAKAIFGYGEMTSRLPVSIPGSVEAGK